MITNLANLAGLRMRGLLSLNERIVEGYTRGVYSETMMHIMKVRRLGIAISRKRGESSVSWSLRKTMEAN